jgi:hypothetical protein
MLLYGLAVLVPLLATSCVGDGAGIDRCAGWRPIEGQPKDADVISDRLFQSIQQHNKHWDKECGAVTS